MKLNYLVTNLMNLSTNVVNFFFPRQNRIYIIDIKRKKVKNKEDKVKEVTLSEWMRLAGPQSNRDLSLHWTTISSHILMINLDVGYVRYLGPLISYLCFATFNENWTTTDMQCR